MLLPAATAHDTQQPALPPGVRMPRFADAGRSQQELRAMLVELQSCGWCGPDRIDRATVNIIANWRNPACAIAGVRAFVADVAASNLPSRIWSSAAVGACRRSLAQPADGHHGPSRAPTARDTYAAAAEPRTPSFAAAERNDLPAFLEELRKCGWISESRIRPAVASHIAAMRDHAAVCAGLRDFVSKIAGGWRKPRDWSGAAIAACRRKDLLPVVGYGGGSGTRESSGTKRHSRSQSRERGRGSSRRRRSRSTSRSPSAAAAAAAAVAAASATARGGGTAAAACGAVVRC
jgi:hypothetical protein